MCFSKYKSVRLKSDFPVQIAFNGLKGCKTKYIYYNVTNTYKVAQIDQTVVLVYYTIERMCRREIN